MQEIKITAVISLNKIVSYTLSLAEITALSNCTIVIITNYYLEFRILFAKWAPQMLTPEQMRERIVTAI